MDWTGASFQLGSPGCTVGQDRDSRVTSSAVAVLVLALLTPDRQVAAAEPDRPWYVALGERFTAGSAVDVGRRSGSTVGGLMSTTVAVGRRLTPAVALELEAAVGLRDNGARVGGWGGDHLGLSGAAGVRVAANGLVGPVLAARLGYDHQATSWSTPWDGDVSGSRAQGRETLGWVYGDVRVGVEGRWRWLSASAALRLTTGPVVTSACHVDVMEAEPDSLLYRAAQAELPSWLVTGGWDVRVAASF